MADDRSEYVARAKLAEHLERYEDMVYWMKKVVELGQPGEEERNLLSVAYKNVIGGKRSAWRVLSGLEKREKEKGNEDSVLLDYKKKIEKELIDVIDEVLNLLEKILTTDFKGKAVEKVFYYKMKADYYRYKSEITVGDEKKDASKGSADSYQKANEEAEELSVTHPIRLGLALNYSVFYYEIIQDSEKACTIAKKAFDDAIGSLDNLKEESYKDSTLILQLLRDNLTLWTSDRNDDGEQDL